MLKDYSPEVQKLFIDFMLADAQNYVRVQNIFNTENFHRTLKPTVEFIKEHSDKFKALPDPHQLKATTGYVSTPIPDATESHVEWFLTEFENFTKRKEIERAIGKAVDLLEKGEFDPVEKLIKDAVQISLTKDMGTDYFADPRARLTRIKDRSNQVTTGWRDLDQLLYGGFNRGDLQIFAGGSGSGKSLVMQNLAVNWTYLGLNGVYISHELSEDLCSMRMDSMFTKTPAREVLRCIDDVELKLKVLSKKYGQLRIKYLPAQSTVNDIRSYLKELQIQTGMRPDFVCVDYLDLLMPVSAKVSPNDLFVKDKYVSEELRNFAKEWNVLFVTASQLNRSAVEEVEFDHSHISGGISKINTADNVFGIFTSRAMRERGRYQIQAMKTRSSSGVGQKIELSFDIDSLRIEDLAEDASSADSASPVTSIMSKIKGSAVSSLGVSNSPTERVDPSTGEIFNKAPSVPAGDKSAKLKQMLANIKT